MNGKKQEKNDTKINYFKQLINFTFYEIINNDDLVKSPFYPIFVIPAKAGIQLIQAVLSRLGGTAFAGVTAFLTFYEFINNIRTKFMILYSPK